ncbi:DUF397 domain-containing protein [Actinokineospora sp.]|uniref:DUF397 domain-containing protein n=1 Tax=Actinokineospora sp. TaxID=1872133 RepID=UPI00403765A1
MSTTSRWRKSSSSAQESACVEVIGSLGAVRDSKNPGPHLPVHVPGLVAWLCDEPRVGPARVTSG